MIEQFIPYLIFCAALGSGLIAGLFFAFSSFVMNALDRLPEEQSIASMKAINIAVLNRLFLTVFMGTTLASILLAVFSLFNWENQNAVYLHVGSMLYLFGSFLVTVICNVPLNDALVRVNAKDADSVTVWKEYKLKWTVWNHIRTVTSLAAFASFILAFLC